MAARNLKNYSVGNFFMNRPIIPIYYFNAVPKYLNLELAVAHLNV
jgi:hypothetical protein